MAHLDLQGHRDAVSRIVSERTPQIMKDLLAEIICSKKGHPMPDSAHEKSYRLVYELLG